LASTARQARLVPADRVAAGEEHRGRQPTSLQGGIHEELFGGQWLVAGLPPAGLAR
jgi:hypothetical protein